MPRPNTRSSSQALRQPASATDVNVIKVLLVLLRRLENIGKWNVRKMIEELQKDIQEAASFELRNLWYLTDEKKNGDPTAFVDVGDRRPHSDRQPATPEDLTNAQWFFQAVFSELGKEYDRRQQ
ncbi:hypothetical protein B9Z55_023875 [Caenorhabditis nigoni]|uniref:Uncharacterized protein n=1 Tax=Caenorhabditis nigoni TaxID=1611254 RepID=A0A2G5SRR6_9PELO|nr:hypothetical protein B9Z55_023875 [Caenorhabditis nigoni]